MLLRHRPEVPASLEGSELAARVPFTELAEVLKIGTTVSLPEGKSLLRESSFGREFLLLIEGSMTVRRSGEDVATLEAGDFVGEMSLLDVSFCNASVDAASDVKVMAFNRREFASALNEAPAFGRYVREVASSRVSA